MDGKFFSGLVVGAGVLGLGFLAVRAHRQRAEERAEAERKARAIANVQGFVQDKVTNAVGKALFDGPFR